MNHAHHWKLDGKGYGVCDCGEERQFKNSWDVKQTDPLRRPREQVAKELAALHKERRPERVLPFGKGENSVLKGGH